jgi:hypothetical protein
MTSVPLVRIKLTVAGRVAAGLVAGFGGVLFLRPRLVQRRRDNRIGGIDLHVNHGLATIGFVAGNGPYTNAGKRGDAGDRCRAQRRRARSKQARQE